MKRIASLITLATLLAFMSLPILGSTVAYASTNGKAANPTNGTQVNQTIPKSPASTPSSLTPNCSGLLTSNSGCNLGHNQFLIACPKTSQSTQQSTQQSLKIIVNKYSTHVGSSTTNSTTPTPQPQGCQQIQSTTQGILVDIFSAITNGLGNMMGQIMQSVFMYVFLRPFQISPGSVQAVGTNGGGLINAQIFVQNMSAVLNGMRNMFLYFSFIAAPLIFAIYGLMKMMGNEDAIRDEMGSFLVRVFAAFFLAFFGQLLLVDILNVSNFLTEIVSSIFVVTNCTTAYPLVQSVCHLYQGGAGALFGDVLAAIAAAIGTSVAGSAIAGAGALGGLGILVDLLMLLLTVGMEMLGFIGLSIFRVIELGLIYITFPVLSMLLILPKTGTALVGRVLRTYIQWAFTLVVWATILAVAFAFAYTAVTSIALPMGVIISLLAVAAGFYAVIGSTAFMGAVFGSSVGGGVAGAIIGMGIISGMSKMTSGVVKGHQQARDTARQNAGKKAAEEKQVAMHEQMVGAIGAVAAGQAETSKHMEGISRRLEEQRGGSSTAGGTPIQGEQSSPIIDPATGKGFQQPQSPSGGGGNTGTASDGAPAQKQGE